jgi:uncharacterized protein (UPF0332 family)
VSAIEAGMARSRDEIEAAGMLSRAGFSAQSVSRSYYAAFYAAEAVLLSLGESRSKHAGVVSAFGQLAVKQQGLDEQAGRLLRSLFGRRSHADYDLGPVPPEEANRAVADAQTVVTLVDQLFQQRKMQR